MSLFQQLVRGREDLWKTPPSPVAPYVPPAPSAAPRCDDHDQMADAWLLRGGAPQRCMLDPAWTELTVRFNDEFHDILHVFAGQPLASLFTAEQRDKLSAYTRTHVIPDRLFNGDDLGNATAQQRIVLSSKILADGVYQPGSFVQEVHARACFHWARIVYQYAGVASANLTQGITGSFDINGGVLLGSGRTQELYHGRRDADLDPSEGHLAQNGKAFRMGNAPWDLVKELQPGDWIYVYNGNKSNSGAHSVIFAGWAGPEQGEVGGRYRAAMTFDQGMPDQGGNQHHYVLGEDLFETPDGHTAHPVNNIMRVAPDARPADEVADLLPSHLSKSVSKDNAKFVKRLLRKHAGDGPAAFDHEGFATWLQAENATLVEDLGDRLTPGQTALLLEANRSADELDLICLNQRLTSLTINRDLLEEKEPIYGQAIDAERAAVLAAQEAQRAVLLDELGGLESELWDLQNEETILRDRLAEIDTSGELEALRAERGALKKQRKKLGKGDDTTAIDGRLGEIKASIEGLTLIQREFAREVRNGRRALGKIEKREERLEKKILGVVGELEAQDPEEVFWLVNTASSRGEIKKHGMDGRYDSLAIDDEDWDRFIQPVAGSA